MESDFGLPIGINEPEIRFKGVNEFPFGPGVYSVPSFLETSSVRNPCINHSYSDKQDNRVMES